MPSSSTPPTVVITTPPNGATYLLNAAVAANYACTDGLAGIASCAGPVANGANINTASVGGKSFAVNATDQAGNAASLTHTTRCSTATSDSCRRS